MRREALKRLLDAFEAIEAIERFIENCTLDHCLDNELIQSAVESKFESHWPPHSRRPLDPPQRRALARAERHRPAVHHPAKSEALFSPSTRTRDLAFGPSLFHWESQSRAGRARSPSLSFAWGLRATRVMRASDPWRFAGGWSGRSRRPTCLAVPRHLWRWRFEGGGRCTAGRE